MELIGPELLLGYLFLYLLGCLGRQLETKSDQLILYTRIAIDFSNKLQYSHVNKIILIAYNPTLDRLDYNKELCVC